jgi:hypothetical protein
MSNGIYVSSFCNFAHRLKDGKPIEHECYVIPPRLLELERSDHPDARDAWADWSMLGDKRRIMRKGVKG